MWWSPRAVGLHVTVAVVVPVCLALCDWQVHRAAAGNTLSWAYAFEWPFFAAYALYMWWRLVHEPVQSEGARAPDPGSVTSASAAAGLAPEDQDDELAAYNRYLAALHEEDRQQGR